MKGKYYHSSSNNERDFHRHETFVPSFGAPWQEVLVCIGFAIIEGTIAYLGVQGSTLANIILNVIQTSSRRI